MQSHWLWMPHETEGYLAVRETGTSRDGVSVTSSLGQVFALEGVDRLERAVRPDEDVEDMALMEDLSEAAMLQNLRIRFNKDQIYTRIASLLVSVNPFKAMPIYSEAAMARYYRAGCEGTIDTLHPHIFGFAHRVYASLCQDREDQSVVISGESGAGKTEATKLVLQYLSYASQPNTSTRAGIETQVLEANPIMEAFGNAKTVRNNNSSRFGKWIQLHMNDVNRICGLQITNYLLEKSRVVSHGTEERNYHVFYQILSSSELTAKFKLDANVKAHHYLRCGSAPITYNSDESNLEQLIEAMRLLRFSGADTEVILQTVAGVLHLGNIAFTNNGQDCAVLDPSCKGALREAAACLGLDMFSLLSALTIRTIHVARERMEKKQTAQQSHSNRDTLAKAIYSRLFDTIIQRINETLGVQTRDATCHTIGLLDIFGFEVFDRNVLEQLFINFANEKLQNHFNHHIFKLEQEEYKQEGIPVDHVGFVDNQPCLDLFEASKIGIFPLIDEELRLPQGSDAHLLESMHLKHDSKRLYKKPRIQSSTFSIIHFAGQVIYDSDGLLDKSRDTLTDDLASAMQKSSVAFIEQLFPPATEKKKPQSLGLKFRTKLDSLMLTLNRTNPHFMRCIKSSSTKTPNSLDANLVLRQLRCLGLQAFCAIRQTGFPIRMKHQDFVQRYRLLLKERDEDMAESCRLLMQAASIQDTMWQLGRTKVFMKDHVELKLQRQRQAVQERFIVHVQCRVRGFLARRHVRKGKQLLIEMIDLEQQVSHSTLGGREQIDTLRSMLTRIVSQSKGVAIPLLYSKLGYLSELILQYEQLSLVFTSLSRLLSPAHYESAILKLQLIDRELASFQQYRGEGRLCDVWERIESHREALVKYEESLRLVLEPVSHTADEDRIQQIQSCLAQSEQLLIQGPSEMELRRLSDRLEHRSMIRKQLKALCNADPLSVSIEELRPRLMEAEHVSMQSDTAYVEAHALLVKLEARQSALRSLEAAIVSCDLLCLDNAIHAAQSVLDTFPHDEVFITKMEAAERAMSDAASHQQKEQIQMLVSTMLKTELCNVEMTSIEALLARAQDSGIDITALQAYFDSKLLFTRLSQQLRHVLSQETIPIEQVQSIVAEVNEAPASMQAFLKEQMKSEMSACAAILLLVDELDAFELGEDRSQLDKLVQDAERLRVEHPKLVLAKQAQSSESAQKAIRAMLERALISRDQKGFEVALEQLSLLRVDMSSAFHASVQESFDVLIQIYAATLNRTSADHIASFVDIGSALSLNTDAAKRLLHNVRELESTIAELRRIKTESLIPYSQLRDCLKKADAATEALSIKLALEFEPLVSLYTRAASVRSTLQTALVGVDTRKIEQCLDDASTIGVSFEQLSQRARSVLQKQETTQEELSQLNETMSKGTQLTLHAMLTSLVPFMKEYTEGVSLKADAAVERIIDCVLDRVRSDFGTVSADEELTMVDRMMDVAERVPPLQAQATTLREHVWKRRAALTQLSCITEAEHITIPAIEEALDEAHSVERQTGAPLPGQVCSKAQSQLDSARETIAKLKTACDVLDEEKIKVYLGEADRQRIEHRLTLFGQGILRALASSEHGSGLSQSEAASIDSTVMDAFTANVAQSCFEWTACPIFRSPAEFAKAGLWAKIRRSIKRATPTAQYMFEHWKGNTSLNQSLIVLPSAALLSGDRDLLASALQCFQWIQMVMGDRPLPKDTSMEVIMHRLEETGLYTRELRDEIYAQALKQIHGNSNEKSVSQGWSLLSTLSSRFVPTSTFLKYVAHEALIASKQESTSAATTLLERLAKATSGTGRQGFQSRSKTAMEQSQQQREIKSFINKKRNLTAVTVHLMDGGRVDCPVSLTSTVQDVIDMVADVFQFDQGTKRWGLFEMVQDKGSHPLAFGTLVVDTDAADPARPVILVLKRFRVVTPLSNDIPISSHEQWLSLMEFGSNLRHGVYSTDFRDEEHVYFESIVRAANDSIHVQHATLCENGARGGIGVYPATRSYLEECIRPRVAQLVAEKYTVDDFFADSHLNSFPVLGSHLFPVTQTENPYFPVALELGITWNKVLIMQSGTKEVMCSILFDDILFKTCIDSKLVLKADTDEGEETFFFQTPHASTIRYMLNTLAKT